MVRRIYNGSGYWRHNIQHRYNMLKYLYGPSAAIVMMGGAGALTIGNKNIGKREALAAAGILGVLGAYKYAGKKDGGSLKSGIDKENLIPSALRDPKIAERLGKTLLTGGILYDTTKNIGKVYGIDVGSPSKFIEKRTPLLEMIKRRPDEQLGMALRPDGSYEYFRSVASPEDFMFQVKNSTKVPNDATLYFVSKNGFVSELGYKVQYFDSEGKPIMTNIMVPNYKNTGFMPFEKAILNPGKLEVSAAKYRDLAIKKLEVEVKKNREEKIKSEARVYGKYLEGKLSRDELAAFLEQKNMDKILQKVEQFEDLESNINTQISRNKNELQKKVAYNEMSMEEAVIKQHDFEDEIMKDAMGKFEVIKANDVLLGVTIGRGLESGEKLAKLLKQGVAATSSEGDAFEKALKSLSGVEAVKTAFGSRPATSESSIRQLWGTSATSAKPQESGSYEERKLSEQARSVALWDIDSINADDEVELMETQRGDPELKKELTDMVREGKGYIDDEGELTKHTENIVFNAMTAGGKKTSEINQYINTQRKYNPEALAKLAAYYETVRKVKG